MLATTITVGAVVAATLVYSSTIEWFFHSVIHHRWFAREHARHHADYHRENFQRPGPFRRLQPPWVEVVVLALHTPAYLAIGKLFGAASAVAAFTVMAAYAVLYDHFHAAIHCPRQALYERTGWYAAMVERHRTHHRDQRVYFCILLPIGDWLFRTISRRKARTNGRSSGLTTRLV